LSGCKKRSCHAGDEDRRLYGKRVWHGKTKKVRDVLFQALIFDNIKTKYGIIYVKLYTISILS
jgi:hypothetical protein